MSLSLAAVTRISVRVTAVEFPGVSVNGVVSRSDGGGRVELMLSIPNHSPSRVMLSLPRNAEADLEGELRSKLTASLTRPR